MILLCHTLFRFIYFLPSSASPFGTQSHKQYRAGKTLAMAFLEWGMRSWPEAVDSIYTFIQDSVYALILADFKTTMFSNDVTAQGIAKKCP